VLQVYMHTMSLVSAPPHWSRLACHSRALQALAMVVVALAPCWCNCASRYGREQRWLLLELDRHRRGPAWV